MDFVDILHACREEAHGGMPRPLTLHFALLPRTLRSHNALSRCASPLASGATRWSTSSIGEYDAAQLAMMEEMCIVVDFEDNLIGEGTKKEVHLIDGVCMLPGGPPHRAFSVFLFNENNELLVQKRCDLS